jgi:hypothetical protein
VENEMQSFIWGAASLALMVIVVLVFLVVKIDIGDVVYTMLSGSIVGLLAGIYSFNNGGEAHRSVLLIFSGIAASIGSWLFTLLLLKITTVTIYSNTALAFDLIVGLVGSASLCFFLLGRNVDKQTEKA